MSQPQSESRPPKPSLGQQFIQGAKQASWNGIKRVGRFSLGIIVAGTVVGLISSQKRARDLHYDKDTVVYWRLKDLIVEEESSIDRQAWWMRLSNPTVQATTFLTLLKSLNAMEHDTKISGLYIDFSGGAGSGHMGIGQMEELRHALERLKKSRANSPYPIKTVAFSDTFPSQLHYALATACDEVRMEPTGQLPLGGISVTQPFFKKLFDKLGIEFQNISAGKFKSFGSNLTESTWPEDQKANLGQLIASLNDKLFAWIGSARRLKRFDVLDEARDLFEVDYTKSKAPLARLAGISPLTAQEAVFQGLVDVLSYKRELTPVKKDLYQKEPSFGALPNPTSPLATLDGHSCISMGKYIKIATAMEKRRLRKHRKEGQVHLGIVNLTGTIHRNNNKVQKALLEAARHPTVDAIVLRVDSGGGDVQTSDQIWETIQYIRKELKKEVYATYGNVAASGGVYATSGCTKIFCNTSTVTGSIGVASLRPHIPLETLETKLGVTMGEMHTSESAKTSSVLHRLEGSALSRSQNHIARIYELFKSRVAQGRRISMEQVEEVAQGQVFTGDKACEYHLVDYAGSSSYQDAIAQAVYDVVKPSGETSKAAIGRAILNSRMTVFPRRKEFWEQMSDQNLSGVNGMFMELVAGVLKREWQEATRPNSADLSLEIDIGDV
ncbi:hypothetical protein HDU91_005308 [Kappamyces sp. JEL0680]|nr:hypothetical protein HDU91_005308 [Kappamyces sp. JEL0680]